jgi:hypothetical protein
VRPVLERASECGAVEAAAEDDDIEVIGHGMSGRSGFLSRARIVTEEAGQYNP